MPSVHLPYINIALNSFALLVALIVFSATFKGFSSKSVRGKYFFLLLSATMAALVADIAAWLCEGHPSVAALTVISNTVASCAGQLAIICFMGYLTRSLYESSPAAAFTLRLFSVLGGLSILFSIGNAFFGYAFAVNGQGHYHHSDSMIMGVAYLLFPILAFLAIVLMAVFARSSTKVNRALFLVYTLFPVAGIVLDYTVHGISLTYVGLTVSVLTIYTSIYLKKQRLIEDQKNALMISQINPHFIYNTLSTIASMCDVSPNRAKYLTIDFSRYLRQNLSNLTNQGLIPFEQELGHVECYLKIEKARFREHLNVIYSIQCKDFDIPPLSVQPLVENAIKHGVTKRAEGGTVKISTYETDRHRVIEIIDDGVGFDTASTDMHVGLANVRGRIAAMCKGEVSVKSTVGVGTRVTIELPKDRKQKGKRR